MIIIDTDVLIEISDKLSINGEQIYQKIISSGEKVAITSITLYEILYGLIKRKKPIQSLLSFTVFEFGRQDAQQAARLEVELEQKGKKVKRTDIMIASIAINRDAVLCTFDKDFKELADRLRLLIE
jgi:predicted nucleic acid-binding protein